MEESPILKEVREIRRKYAERFDYDIRRIVRAAQRQEKKSGRKVISPPKKRLAKPVGK